ncbi:hypothetical protein KP509_33G003500 [Ceratopteris richardii]|uniref:TIR domain-containing protein n=2 Tax=Ceratopteris richardii TaxID=49495 RepID=A0A8T2QMW6_CERRI|nr:hypothetical protein KP509_33G003500 [Ceratopteris richardii]
MREGTEVDAAILEAIKMSKVHIVFLTPDFASSRWCLNEVLEIMNIQRTADTSCVSRKALVLPVFYDVKPSVVRYQPESSAYNLGERTKHSTPEEMAQWSEALKALSFVKGFEYDTKTTRQWEKLQEIASTVEAFLNKTLPRVHEPEWRNYFAGQIDEVVKALKSSGSESKDVFSVGVYGPNKSMLADLLVDDLRSDFEARCLLYNVMDTASHSDGVSALIRKLYKDLVEKDHEQPLRRNARLDDLLQNKRCLVVLDEVGSDVRPIQPLLSILKQVLKKNSLVVFTSRFQHVLREMVKVDKFISLSGGEENKGYSLIVCYNKRDDVHPVFISFFQDTFYMLGLDVCLLSEDEFVSCSRNAAKAQVIVCIISKSSNVGYLKRTLVNASTNDEPKVLYVYYGRQSTIEGTLSTSVCLNVNFEESTGQPHKMEYKHLVEVVMEMFKEGNEKSMDVTDFPVGLLQREMIESRILSHMSRSHRSVQYFGLWGRGGVGKTTTVKSIYNRMRKEFKSSAHFLDTKAEMTSTNSGLVHVQRKILKNLKPKGIVISKIKTADDGKRVLSSHLKGMSAFIVFDDLDTRSQIDALCCPLSSLGANSVVIITGRNREILTYASIPDENIFCIEGLSEENSEWLFCWHAFMNPAPPTHLKEVAKEVVEACQGLPLSLTVLGCHLYGASDINKWKESLHLIKQDEKNIFDFLSVSLNSLKLSEKEAFLDICCFFIGREEDFVCEFLEGCYEMGTTILTALKCQCLITVKSTIKDNPYDVRREVQTIQIHDQLRDMGRYIIQKEEKNRAWDEKTSNDILKDARALSGLRGLSARTDIKYPGEVASSNSFSQLRFLELEEAEEKGEMNEIITISDLFATVRCDDLRWLAWRLPEDLPRGLCSKELRVLHLSWSGIRELPGPLPSLKILEIEECFNLEGFSTEIGKSMPLLRRLNFSRCKRLKSLDSSIGRLTDLRSLTIKWCDSMMHLPEEMRKLSSLRELTLGYLTQIKTFSLPPNLRTLTLRECWSLESLDDASFPDLEQLHVWHCPKLKKLPVLGSSLARLTVDRCDGLVLDDDDECLEWKDLPSLRELSLGCLTQIKTLSLPPNLQMLTLRRCCGLQSVNASFPHLEQLHVRDCPMLRKLPVLGNSLARLVDNEWLELKDLPSLRELSLTFPGKIKTLSLPPNLRTLILRGCESLESVHASLANLEELRLFACRKLKKLPVLGSSLVQLRAEYCDGLVIDDECLEFKDLPSLRELNLRALTRIKTLSLPKSLQTLTLEECWSLENMDASFLHLQELDIRDCGKLKKLRVHGSSLVRVTVDGCGGLVLDDDDCLELKDLPSVRELKLSWLSSLKCVSCLPTNLRDLSLEYCGNLERVDLSTVTDLRSLSIYCCRLSFDREEVMKRFPSLEFYRQ